MKVSKDVEVVADTKFVSLVKRGFEHNGVKGDWAYATRRKVIPGRIQPGLVDGKSGLVGVRQSLGEDRRAVIIIAKVFRENWGGGEDYVLNKEFRVPLVGGRESGKCWEISFPAGLIDKGETPEEAAMRELAEETPYEIREIKEVSPPLASSSGITDEMVHIVRCTARLKKDGATAREPSEDIETFLARDSRDSRIPKGDDIVWSVRAWMELDKESFINSGSHVPDQFSGTTGSPLLSE